MVKNIFTIIIFPKECADDQIIDAITISQCHNEFSFCNSLKHMVGSYYDSCA